MEGYQFETGMESWVYSKGFVGKREMETSVM